MALLKQTAQKLGVRDEELRPLAAGIGGFCAALAGYFLLLPLRDEAGVALGTDKLPRLFVASLFLTFLATPLASAFLNHSPARERGLQLLFRVLSLSVLGFVVLYTAAGPPLPASPDVANVQHAAGERHGSAAPGAAVLTSAQTAVRAAFFLWVSLLNLVAVSSLWARSADVFSPEAAGRLFGLLGAGATLGQLLGSLAARALARAPVLGGGDGSPSLLPLLASAACLELAGQAALRYRLVKLSSSNGGSGSANAAEAGKSPQPTSRQASPLSKAGSGGKPAAVSGKGASSPLQSSGTGSMGKPGGWAGRLLGRTVEGFRLIRASPYLRHICLYLGLNYATSSVFYFEKTLVVARVPDAASRTAIFATINSTSAFAILVLQVLATGHVLRHLGLPIALSVLPASAGVLLSFIAAWPAPITVAAAEVCRKLLAYSLARPARESLYTVLTREEKYSAKLFLDTVVQRIGDTTAAALFQTLVPALGFGPSELALVVVPVTAAWAATAYSLGRRQQQLAQAQFLAQ